VLQRLVWPLAMLGLTYLDTPTIRQTIPLGLPLLEACFCRADRLHMTQHPATHHRSRMDQRNLERGVAWGTEFSLAVANIPLPFG
jgi:hypothetical protein